MDGLYASGCDSHRVQIYPQIILIHIGVTVSLGGMVVFERFIKRRCDVSLSELWPHLAMMKHINVGLRAVACVSLELLPITHP